MSVDEQIDLEQQADFFIALGHDDAAIDLLMAHMRSTGGGITVEGVRYRPIEATLDREQGANAWLTLAIREGKNREVRKVLETLGLRVNRLIRVTFGPFQLGDLDEGAVKEIETQALRAEIGEKITAEAGADFDAPLVEELEDKPLAKRPSPSTQLRRAPSERHERGASKKRTKHRRDRTGGPRPSRPRPK
jgi:23S rRNA pseudouridine2605 synthase